MYVWYIYGTSRMGTPVFPLPPPPLARYDLLMDTHPARAGELIAPSAAGQQGSTTTKQKTGHRKDSGDPVYFYSEMKAPPALKERVTDGAGKPAGSELRWAGGASRRINPTANAEPMILP